MWWILAIGAVVAYLVLEDSPSSSTASPAVVAELAAGITQAEGVAAQYNNPGGISNSIATGATGQTFGAGLAIYPTLAAGQADLVRVINRVISEYPGITVNAFAQRWIFSKGGPTTSKESASLANYQQILQSYTGLTGDSPLVPAPVAAVDVSDADQSTSDDGTDDDSDDDDSDDDDSDDGD